MTHRFYKDAQGWFIDLPHFIESGLGTKSNLAMVAGADTMLDKLSNGNDNITLEIDDEEFPNIDGKLKKFGLCPYGENYIFSSLETKSHPVWLCPVTKFVFNGKYPKNIYIRKVA